MTVNLFVHNHTTPRGPIPKGGFPPRATAKCKPEESSIQAAILRLAQKEMKNGTALEEMGFGISTDGIHDDGHGYGYYKQDGRTFLYHVAPAKTSR